MRATTTTITIKLDVNEVDLIMGALDRVNHTEEPGTTRTSRRRSSRKRSCTEEPTSPHETTTANGETESSWSIAARTGAQSSCPAVGQTIGNG